MNTRYPVNIIYSSVEHHELNPLLHHSVFLAIELGITKYLLGRIDFLLLLTDCLSFVVRQCGRVV